MNAPPQDALAKLAAAMTGSDKKKTKRKLVTYVVKPDNMSNGRGIFLSRNIDDMLRVTLDRAPDN